MVRGRLASGPGSGAGAGRAGPPLRPLSSRSFFMSSSWEASKRGMSSGLAGWGCCQKYWCCIQVGNIEWECTVLGNQVCVTKLCRSLAAPAFPIIKEGDVTHTRTGKCTFNGLLWWHDVSRRRGTQGANAGRMHMAVSNMNPPNGLCYRNALHHARCLWNLNWGKGRTFAAAAAVMRFLGSRSSSLSSRSMARGSVTFLLARCFLSLFSLYSGFIMWALPDIIAGVQVSVLHVQLLVHSFHVRAWRRAPTSTAFGYAAFASVLGKSSHSHAFVPD